MTSIPTSQILQLWFGPCAQQPEFIPRYSKQWFAVDPEFDQLLRDRFLSALSQAAGEPAWHGTDCHERLARILLLDQFSRNIHRGKAAAFANDPLARKLCMDALESGADTALTPIERSFLAMPLQHAEDREAQQLSVSYFSNLVATARNPDEAQSLANNADFAKQHADIVQRFGRFPHRNDILGRDSNDAEMAYLHAGAPRFGQ